MLVSRSQLGAPSALFGETWESDRAQWTIRLPFRRNQVKIMRNQARLATP
jgi:hypothetical protein